MSDAPPSTGGMPGRAALIVNATVAMLRTLGVDMDRVLANIDLDPDSFEPDAAVPREGLNRLWDEAVRVSGDETLGLRGANLWRPEHFDVVGYAARSSATLGQVSDRTVRYVKLLTNQWIWQRDMEGDSAIFRLVHQGEIRQHPQVVEATLVALGLMSRRLTGVQLVVREARFHHKRPEHADQLENVLGGPCVFSSPDDALLFDPAYQELPILNHDPGLSLLLEKQAEQMLAELPRGDEFTRRVRAVIAENLREGSLTTPEVARKLAVSERSLRRKLAEVNLTYKGLVDEVRHDLARRYLRGDAMGVSEIAFHLGFASVASFGKAFKRWTGTTPGEYRKVGA